MVIADGMGGHHYGEIASQIAVQTLADVFQREARPTLADPFRFPAEGHDQCPPRHYRLRRTPQAERHAAHHLRRLRGPGQRRLLGARRRFPVVLMRDGRVIAQTKDHSRVRLLIEEGMISEAQAAVHPDRNKIYSCLGSPTPPEIEFSRKTPLEHGDIVLLSTDGLWGVTSGEQMALALKGANFLQAVPMLLARPKSRAGRMATIFQSWPCAGKTVMSRKRAAPFRPDHDPG
jgi:hypothetical protein